MVGSHYSVPCVLWAGHLLHRRGRKPATRDVGEATVGMGSERELVFVLATLGEGDVAVVEVFSVR